MMFLAENTPQAGGAGSAISMLWPFALMFVVLYFLLIRPQQKRTKNRNMLLAGLKKGDKVVTIGGLHGTILDINDQTVVLRVNDVTKMTFDRSSINSISQAAPAAGEEKKAEKAVKAADSTDSLVKE